LLPGEEDLRSSSASRYRTLHLHRTLHLPPVFCGIGTANGGNRSESKSVQDVTPMAGAAWHSRSTCARATARPVSPFSKPWPSWTELPTRRA
jgi:hypothetical protein